MTPTRYGYGLAFFRPRFRDLHFDGMPLDSIRLMVGPRRSIILRTPLAARRDPNLGTPIRKATR